MCDTLGGLEERSFRHGIPTQAARQRRDGIPPRIDSQGRLGGRAPPASRMGATEDCPITDGTICGGIAQHDHREGRGSRSGRAGPPWRKGRAGGGAVAVADDAAINAGWRRRSSTGPRVPWSTVLSTLRRCKSCARSVAHVRSSSPHTTLTSPCAAVPRCSAPATRPRANHRCRPAAALQSAVSSRTHGLAAQAATRLATRGSNASRFT